ncbi:MAG: hypothetical protein ABIO68_05790 [Sphingomicrobium sp.]
MFYGHEDAHAVSATTTGDSKADGEDAYGLAWRSLDARRRLAMIEQALGRRQQAT